MDALEETLNNLAINNSGYYESDSANTNDAKCDPARNPRVATHTSEGKKRNVTDTRNRYLKQKILSNCTLPIITMKFFPRIENRVATCGGTPHALAMPTTKEFITDTARSSVRVLWTPVHVRRTCRDNTTPGDCTVSLSSPRMNSPVLIEGTTVSPACELIGSLGILNKYGSTGSVEIGYTKKFDTSIDGIFSKDVDSKTIFRKLIGQELSHISSNYI